MNVRIKIGINSSKIYKDVMKYTSKIKYSQTKLLIERELYQKQYLGEIMELQVKENKLYEYTTKKV